MNVITIFLSHWSRCADFQHRLQEMFGGGRGRFCVVFLDFLDSPVQSTETRQEG